MKKGLKKDIYKSDEDFYLRRSEGLGASDVAVVMNLSQYKLAANLFMEKIGMREIDRVGTEATFWGKLSEDIIAYAWQYYSVKDLSERGHYVKAKAAGEVYRKCERSNGAIHDPNSEYPFLFVSLDRVINKGQPMLPSGEINPDQGILEIKKANVYSIKNWQSSIPPEYLCQLQAQLLVTGLEYAEIAIFDNLNGFEVYYQTPSQPIQDAIIDQCSEFWQLCLKGKELVGHLRAESRPDLQDKLTHEIYQMAPEAGPGQEDLWRQFLDEKYQKELPEPVPGTQEQQLMAEQVKYLAELQKALKQKESALKNQIIESMYGHMFLELPGEKSKVSYKTDAKGSKRLTITAPKPDPSLVEQKIDEILS